MLNVDLDFQLYPKQLAALQTEATELLFGGATEGGKSHFVRVASILWSLEIPGLQSVLIRKKFDDILKNHVLGPTGYNAMLAPLVRLKICKITRHAITFQNGSVVSFQHCQDERQFDSAQGVEKHVLFIDEATQIGEKLIRFFRSWCRMPMEMQERLPEHLRGMFPRIVYTANPIGVSVPFFKRYFVKARREGTIELVEGFKRQFIKSRATDNASVDMAAHNARLQGIGDSALAKALDEGDWDTPIGDYFPEWDELRHVVPDFEPPAHWFRYRTFDWGTAEPFAVYWWAVSDGEMFTAKVRRYEGHTMQVVEQRMWFPRGAIVAYREWYGCDDEHPAQGVRMRNEDIAHGILQRSSDAYEQGLSTLTDSYPFPDRGEVDGMTIAKTFAKCGVPLTLGNTSRVTGWSQMRDRLTGIQIDSNSEIRTPMIYFVESCEAARNYIPALPRHPSPAKMEDAAEHGEATHSCDAIRLACMAQPRVKDVEPKPVDTKDLKPDLTFQQALKRIQQAKAQRNGAAW